MSDTANPIAPERAPVVPRAHRCGRSASLPLDQLVLQPWQLRRSRTVYIVAPPGGGKTTALDHLRAVLPRDLRFELFDEPPQHEQWRPSSAEVLTIVALRQAPADANLAVLELVNWTVDDCLEYLAHKHRERTPSVMRRLQDDPS